MSRVQLALNVSDLEAAVDFYSKLFATEPAKVRPGYANFAIAEPPLKLVLIEGHGEPGSLNHLGVEVDEHRRGRRAQQRLAAEGLATAAEDEVSCCFALQDKVWVDGPDKEPWEIYTVLGDAEMPAGELRTADPMPTRRVARARPSRPRAAADALVRHDLGQARERGGRRHRVPRRDRGRLGYCRAASLARQHGSAAARELDGDRRRVGRVDPGARSGVGRALQSSGDAR